jgi:hypothetical protein
MAAANNQRTITLPPFWTDNAAGWFAHVESRFRAKGVMDEWDGFDHTVAALSKEIIQLCFHAVAHPDDDEPYSVLKEDLLQQHTLTKYQRIERLLAVGPLGSRRPSQLLAEMMELCLDDEEASCFFVFFFLQRLPAWLRIQLEGDDRTTSGGWRRKRTACFPCTGTSTAEWSPWWRARRTRTRPPRSTQSRGAASAATAGAAASEAASGAASVVASQSGSQQQGSGGKALTPSEAAAAAAGICWNHWWFAENASHCKGTAASPCGWQGN